MRTILLVVGLLASPCLLSETGSTFQVVATVTSGCQINNSPPANGTNIGAVGSLDFGTHSTVSTTTLSTSFVAVGGFVLSCTPGIPLTMSIDGGLHFSSGRQVQHTVDPATVSYQLFSDAILTQSIDVNVPIAVDTSTDPFDISLPLYGQLTLPGNVSSGTYNDTLTVTLEW